MRADQIALQAYTVRDFLKTPVEIETSLRKIKQIGYSAVQAASLDAIPDADLARMLQDIGLVCCSLHVGGDDLFDHTDSVIGRLQTLGCTRVAYPWPHLPLTSIQDVKVLAQRLNAAGQTLSEAGITLSYHNHSMEFRRFDGRLILETIYNETDPRYLQGEIDTYWVQHGGGDPADWCRKLKGRLPTLHVKDYGLNDEHKPTFFEIGYGNLNWKEILPAADASGCEWFIVEQDVCARDPFESIKMSFEYLRGLSSS